MNASKVLSLAKETMAYDPLTGLFVRTKEFKFGNYRVKKAKVGDIVGCLGTKGYVRIKVGGVDYAAHRLAWLFSYGKWPDQTIDHINHIRSDNRLANLRDVSQRENNLNRKPQGALK